MLKVFFGALLAANVALLGYGQGWFGDFDSEEHEPQRMKAQLNARQMTVIPAAKATALAAGPDQEGSAGAPTQPAAPAPARPAPAAAPMVACLEAGAFPAADARRFEAQLAALDLGEKLTRRPAAGQDISSYMVMIPPSATRDAAEKKAADLRAKGLTNFYIIPDGQAQKNGISLGVFKAEAAAQTQLAALVKQGVTAARIAPRYSASKQVLFQFRDIDAATRTRLQRIAAKFPEQPLRGCR